ncbi:MAG: hypothetical protein IKR48_05370 [Kiritimatiellae bacterium]|nr:hypothetical protein [Kiritimatiellia bacterium]
MDRRGFMKLMTWTGGAWMGASLTGMAAKAPAIAGDFAWGALLHLGSNMWGDWKPDLAGVPSSAEEEEKMYPNQKPGKHGVLPSRARNYLKAEDAVWHEETDLMKQEGLNLVVIDVGEAYAYPSRPELRVNGSWSPEKMRNELARLRKLGLEPIPKLNFSTGHDIWLKEYHRMTSSSVYYKVVADVIRDVAEVFDTPRYFHIGFDEEIPVAVKGRTPMVIRTGDLWWHDFFYTVKEVEKNGSRPVMWSDKMCAGREEFLKRMTKDVLQMPWYYGSDFSEKKVTWDPAFEEKVDSWETQRNLAASILELDKAGFDMIPCTSNWSTAAAPDAMLKFCKERVGRERLKGFLVAPWAKAFEVEKQKVFDGIRLFAAARRKHFATASL